MTITHKVLARKYRPKRFADLYGQKVLVTTLTNAILYDKLHHAYLLHGIRGVGKTTSARIIASILNCSNVQKNTEGAVEACGKCLNCESFNSASHPDIIEFDAASRTGVDDIRDVLENCEYRPMLGKYKIFIIDEVHMLSKNAFNALLKMIEEPPAHIIFILATTELNKVPLTIISRCQKFDLQRISIPELVQLFEEICKKEDILYAPAALELLAGKADGSARDGLSLLYHLSTLLKDQNQEQITVELINQMLANVDLDQIIKLFNYIITGDSSKALDVLANAYRNNNDLLLIMLELLELVALLTKKFLITGYKQIKYEAYDESLNQLMPNINIIRLNIFWQMLKNAIEELKLGYANSLLISEMNILKMIATNSLSNPSEIIAQTLEEKELPSFKIETIYVFLDHLHKVRNFDLYHYLLNDVQIINYKDKSLVLSSKGSKDILNKKVAIMLASFTGENWSVTCEELEGAVSLKQKLIEQIKESSNWHLLKNYFANSSLTDITHKTTKD